MKARAMASDPKRAAQKPGDDKTDKAERLAQQLRANLRRRKAQANARRDGSAEGNGTDRPDASSTDEGNT